MYAIPHRAAAGDVVLLPVNRGAEHSEKKIKGRVKKALPFVVNPGASTLYYSFILCFLFIPEMRAYYPLKNFPKLRIGN